MTMIVFHTMFLFLFFVFSVIHLSRCEAEGESVRCLDKNTPATDISNIHTTYARDHCYKCDWMNTTLTVIMLYHNECNSLRFLTHSWLQFPQHVRNQIRLLIVDDNSQIPARNCVERYINSDSESSFKTLKEYGISVVRIDDSRPWNIGGARNMGAFYTCSDFLFVCDIDALISAPLLESALLLTQKPLAKSQLQQFNRNFTQGVAKFHPGMMLLGREAYWKNHGCDEDFVGE